LQKAIYEVAGMEDAFGIAHGRFRKLQKKLPM
jgi:hypothetical protein